MSREVRDVSITKLEDGRFRAAIAYFEEDGQASATEVETFDSFEAATDLIIQRESDPSSYQPQTAPAPGRVDAPGESSTTAPHSADPSAQDSPVAGAAQDSPVDQNATVDESSSDAGTAN